MATKIKFGTDGWRSIIGEDFTFANVKKVSRAIAVYLKKEVCRNPKVIIGYDTRFQSKNFAFAAAQTLSESGCNVILSSDFLSTPAVSSNVVKNKADGGIVISASHNPYEFSGIKFKTSKGCSAPENITSRFEEYLEKDIPFKSPNKGKIETSRLTSVYFKHLLSYIDLKAIKKKHLKIVFDPMYGASMGYLETLLKGTKCNVVSLHNTPDPMFKGLHPEPIEEYLYDLKKAVKLNGAAAGLAADGDGDRIGVIDEKGRYYPPHHVFPLLLYYLAKHKNRKGKVVQTISLGYLSRRIAEDYNLEFKEVPVGFKYIAEHILKGGTLIGGEESGGYGYGDFLPERDGILNALMFAEMLSATGKPLSSLLKEIENHYGTSSFLRTDFKKSPDASWTKKEFVERLKSRTPDKIAGLKVKKVKDYDGIEFILEDDSWLLLRPSGTEPIIRVYSESPKALQTQKIIKWGNTAVKNLI
jgi:phosphomannomutase